MPISSRACQFNYGTLGQHICIKYLQDGTNVRLQPIMILKICIICIVCAITDIKLKHARFFKTKDNN